MGGIRRIKKQMANPIAMADARVDFNKCRVFLGNLNPAVAGKAAKEFAEFMEKVVVRSAIVNMRDLYEAHFGILGKLNAGESILN